MDVLHEKLPRILPKEPSNEYTQKLLDRRAELPLQYSRLYMPDLLRKTDIGSCKKRDGIIGSIRDYVWLAVTVSAADCDECLGEELVYMWDIDRKRIVLVCDLCPNILDLAGEQITCPDHLEVPTQQQLTAAGVIK